MGLPDDWRTSDEILDGARDGLAFFAEFLPYYDEAAALAGRGRWRGVTMADAVQRPFDQLRGIDLDMLRADAEMLRSAADATGDHVHNLERHWAGLSGWHGDAADAARAHHERLVSLAAGFLRSPVARTPSRTRSCATPRRSSTWPPGGAAA
jgi:hypothetical protein